MTTRILALAAIGILFITSCNKSENKTENKEQASTKSTSAVDATSLTPNGEPVETDSLFGPEVPFTEAKNYFVKNTYKDGELKNPKITSKADFDMYFGAATTMGNDGKPTAIDFTKQYVIAVIGKTTDKPTSYTKLNLRQKENGSKMFLDYQLTEGEKTTSTMRPLMLLIVDKTYEGPIEVTESKK